jgi:hypothetical protein
VTRGSKGVTGELGCVQRLPAAGSQPLEDAQKVAERIAARLVELARSQASDSPEGKKR